MARVSISTMIEFRIYIAAFLAFNGFYLPDRLIEYTGYLKSLPFPLEVADSCLCVNMSK